MKKIAICFLVSWFMVAGLTAQSYHSAIGLRLGTDFGFTYQQRVGKNNTIEGIIQTGLFERSGQFAVIFEQHQPLLSRGLNMYYGAGPQIGWQEYRGDQVVHTIGGLALIIGAEMSLGKIILSYDIKPNVNLFGQASLFNVDTAISVRTAIVKKSSFDGKNSKSKRNSKSSKPTKVKKKKTHSM